MPKILNNGYVELVEWMGGDMAVIRNARRCWRSESKGAESDRKLIHHLLSKKHMTPFESMVFTFDVKAPLFVARQWFRHRMGGFNEESLRYCVANEDYYIPDAIQNTHQRQMWMKENDRQFKAYQEWVAGGLPKEQARSLLPTGLYTRFYWTVNGSSLLNFLQLRLHKSAQAEIREYADAILTLARDVAPVSFGEWEVVENARSEETKHST